jgi:hypothetical protein
MKSTMMSLIAAMALLLSCSSSRTTTSTSSNQALGVPVGIQSSFQAQYPTAANVTWSKYDAATVPIDWEMTGWSTLSPDDYVVSFDVGNERYYSWYTANGTWVGTTHTVNNHSALPIGVSNLLKERFSGYSIDKIQRELWKDQLAYEIKLKKSDDDKVKLLVDAKGNIIKQKMKD